MSQLNESVPICPICWLDGVKTIQSNGFILWLKCERCGEYQIGIRLASSQAWDEVRHLVSAWIRRENKAGRIPNIASGEDFNYIYSPDWAEQFKHMGFPETTNEKLDALLLAYAESIDGNYGKQFSFGLPYFIADVAAKNQEEIDGLNKLLDELEFIDKSFPTIRAKGWLHIDELRKSAFVSDSAFIAMWFDDTTTKYRDAVITAINYCGYKPVIIDQQEYNDFIMNQVISSIRQSRFLVADFTSRPEIENESRVRNGVRGGVYWEAGMAYGLGRPVIHTCEDSTESRSRIHFDVHQYNTIFWKEDELGIDIRSLDQTRENPNFAEKLGARILATVGRGNYSPSK